MCPPHPKYTQQFIIDAMRNPTDLRNVRDNLTRKYDYPRLEVISIILARGSQPGGDMSLLNTVDNQSRIHVLGHCRPGEFRLYNNNNEHLFVTDLAEMIARGIPRVSSIPRESSVYEYHPEQQLKISLYACCAGSPSATLPQMANHINNSFAARLLFLLRQKGIHCTIAARTGYIAAKHDRPLIPNSPFFLNRLERDVVPIHRRDELYSLFAEYRSLDKEDGFSCYRSTDLEKKMLALCYPEKDKRAKLLYRYDEATHQQIMLPAYPSTHSDWANDVIDVIDECIAATKSEPKKSGLTKLRDFVWNATSDQTIFDEINKELRSGAPSQGYEVHTHSGMKGYFGLKTETWKLLTDVLSRYRSS
jgi:hypothetical protein